MTERRDHQFRIVMSEAEYQLLKELADRLSLSAAALVRMLVRKEHERLNRGQK